LLLDFALSEYAAEELESLEKNPPKKRLITCLSSLGPEFMFQLMLGGPLPLS